MFLEKVRKLF